MVGGNEIYKVTSRAKIQFPNEKTAPIIEPATFFLYKQDYWGETTHTFAR